MKKDRIILTGFMGTGKTAVGQLLAKELKLRFVDTDHLVEQECNQSIVEIFEQKGEEGFRDCEKKVVQKALSEKGIVMATGGGAVLDADNLKLMKEKGTLIALSASAEVIFQRISKLGDRPLLRTRDQLETIKNLISHRSPYYRQADFIVDTSGKSVEQTVQELLKVLHEKNSG
jgi:shikimate kinase